MIMAGGSGTRLWPMSRGQEPKQLIPLFDGVSLLGIAAGRLDGIVPEERQWICAGSAHAASIYNAVPALKQGHLIGEPMGRDTLNAVALTAAVLHHHDNDAIFAVLTADHIITPQDEFARCLDAGFKLVEEVNNRFITFGITPTHPATGYGYVELGAAIGENSNECVRFVEKPDEARATEYIETGCFVWNSGMFIFHAGVFLETLSRLQPENYKGIMEIAASLGTQDEISTIERVYPMLPKISVDYGMMEPASKDDSVDICTVPMTVTWLDVGSWPTYGETLIADGSGNRSDTNALHLDSKNVLAVSSDKQHTITTIGCEDLIIVHTPDATLVFPASEAQRVKEMHALVDKSLQ